MMSVAGSAEAKTAPDWHLLSSHARVLVCLARDPKVRLRDVARAVGLTERAVQRIVSDLDEWGLVHKHRDGRRNYYVLVLDARLADPIEGQLTVGELVSPFVEG
jgi:DNA-binding IclR family transcriptional regulator